MADSEGWHSDKPGGADFSTPITLQPGQTNYQTYQPDGNQGLLYLYIQCNGTYTQLGDDQWRGQQLADGHGTYDYRVCDQANTGKQSPNPDLNTSCGWNGRAENNTCGFYGAANYLTG